MLGTVPPYSTGGAAVPAMDSHSDSAPVLYAAGNPASFDPLNQFGYANRQYTAADMCPFK